MRRLNSGWYFFVLFTGVLVAGGELAGAPTRVRVDFGETLRPWDGFGVNYVQTAQTRDYKADPQEYGGFSLLKEEQRQKILEMIFGEDGLKPGLLKMFLDPWHEETNDNNDPNTINPTGFDHKTSTEWLRYFAREGLSKTRKRGGDLTIITTLYGPPAWTTKQKFVRGRDLDPAMKHEVAEHIREKNPKLHSWVTSQSWEKMDASFVNTIRGNIYVAKVNGLIPWAALQRPPKWVGGDPNPGTAFEIDEQGNYHVKPGYYFYKQVSRAGQPGMAVAHVASLDSEVGLIAFAGNKTKHPDAFVAVNFSAVEKLLAIRVLRCGFRTFEAYRTSQADQYRLLGTFAVEGGVVSYSAPSGSVTAFFGK